jgi:hypothetical protein
MNIPSIFQSSVDPTQVSLTIISIGKAGATLIVFLGVIGFVDPAIAGQDWSSFVQAMVTAVPAVFAVFYSGEAVYGLIRKLAVRFFGPPTPSL